MSLLCNMKANYFYFRSNNLLSFPNLPVPLKNESKRNREREEDRGKERGRVLKFRMGWRRKEREQGNKPANMIVKG